MITNSNLRRVGALKLKDMFVEMSNRFFRVELQWKNIWSVSMSKFGYISFRFDTNNACFNNIREYSDRHITEVKNGNNTLASVYDTLPDIQVPHP